MSKRSNTQNEEWAAFLTPIVRTSFLDLVKIIAHLEPEVVRASLQRMVGDSSKVLFWERGDTRAWDSYYAGGTMGPDRIELTVSTELAGISVSSLLNMLHALGADQAWELEATSIPWRFVLQVSPMPQVIVQAAPSLERPEDLVFRIVVGARPNLFGDKTEWERYFHVRLSEAMDIWVADNEGRPFSDHPVFNEFIEPPGNGSPGVYLTRIPPFPYSPLFPVALYKTQVTWVVTETEDEITSCHNYYRSAGESFFPSPPYFRNCPPCTQRPARLAGSIVQDAASLIHTPWPGYGTIVIYTLGDAALARSPRLRRTAFRGRYLLAHSDDESEALRGIGLSQPRMPGARFN